ncbi:MAG: hydrogenase nickel incorporation protein HypB [Ignavibacteria bacterium]|nr:hydrogenase nickel incorporation protein HypB [Ignavibacteria bacterium]
MGILTVERKLLEKNDIVAQELRGLFTSSGMFVLNMVSSPGSGKTSLVEATIKALQRRVRIGVIEGDVQTDLDARRIDALNVPVVQIVTHGACHLEAPLVRDAYRQLADAKLDILIIENVGNLVCPAAYDLGESLKVVVASTTEGDDKPLKYPAMFRHARVLIINKVDLIPYVQCSLETLRANALAINPSLVIFETSCTTSQGITAWCDWIVSEAASHATVG